MKKLFILLAIILFSYRAETPVEYEFKKPKIALKIDRDSPVLVMAPGLPEVTAKTRAPAQVRPQQTRSSSSRPVRLAHLVVRDPEIKTSTGEWIASNISALPLSSYDASYGKEIYRDQHFAYFEGKTEESLPVAFNPVDQRFHPLSQVLLLKKINEELRREILDEGHKEYYYHQRMGLLSIQSTSQEILSLYSEFKKRGLDVRLEVLKETAQPR